MVVASRQGRHLQAQAHHPGSNLIRPHYQAHDRDREAYAVRAGAGTPQPGRYDKTPPPLAPPTSRSLITHVWSQVRRSWIGRSSVSPQLPVGPSYMGRHHNANTAKGRACTAQGSSDCLRTDIRHSQSGMACRRGVSPMHGRGHTLHCSTHARAATATRIRQAVCSDRARQLSRQHAPSTSHARTASTVFNFVVTSRKALLYRSIRRMAFTYAHWGR